MSTLNLMIGAAKDSTYVKDLLRQWCQKLVDRLEEHRPGDCDHSETSLGYIHYFIHMDICDNFALSSEELVGAVKRQDMFGFAAELAEELNLNITAHGLDLAMVNVHGEHQTKVVVCYLKMMHEIVKAIAGADSPVDCVNANDVAAHFNYGIISEGVLEQMWREQSLQVPIQARSNLLELVCDDDFEFDKEEGEQLRDDIFRDMTVMGLL